MIVVIILTDIADCIYCKWLVSHRFLSVVNKSYILFIYKSVTLNNTDNPSNSAMCMPAK
jgi:hypothetical protein